MGIRLPHHLRSLSTEANRAPTPPRQLLIWQPATTGTSPSAHNRGHPRTHPHVSGSSGSPPPRAPRRLHTTEANRAPPLPTSVAHLAAPYHGHLAECTQPRPTTHFLLCLLPVWLCACSSAALEKVCVARSIAGYGLECGVDTRRRVRCVKGCTGAGITMSHFFVPSRA